MGYQARPKVYKLVFDDDEYEGLVVRARSVKLGQILRLSRLVGMDPANLRPEDTENFEQLFTMFADALVDWNLDDDDGEPVPATLEGIQGQDADFVMPIIKAWFVALAGVTGPLGAGSSNGKPSAEPSIPMEAR